MPLGLALFHRNLRLADNSALFHAAKNGQVIPVFIDADASSQRNLGGASRWWLRESLIKLQASLKALCSDLIYRAEAGESFKDLLARLIEDTGADSVYFEDDLSQLGEIRKAALKEIRQERGISVHCYRGRTLFAPGDIQTQAGKHYTVFSPFWRNLLSLPEPSGVLPIPPQITPPTVWPKSDGIGSLNLEPKGYDWTGTLVPHWQPGEVGANERLEAYLESGALETYNDDRNFPAMESATSRLSPHLVWGEVSVRTVWTQVRAKMQEEPNWEKGGLSYLREIGWREFSNYLLHYYPDMATAPMKPDFAPFPWQEDEGAVERWQKGQTGYPFVDAAMRELWQTGYMHGRTRMVVASFLAKHLLIDWRRGEDWFWDTLVDAEDANNAANWQWVAGCGMDASPYFRIFNPITQGEKFDKNATYIRKYVPEIAHLSDKEIHTPWKVTGGVSGDLLGGGGETNYPSPIVDHASARALAMEAYQSLKS